MVIENIGNNHHITVDAFALQKFRYILKSKYNYEFTAFFHSEKRENDEYHLFDIFFPRQDNTGVTTECDSDDLIELMEEGADISMLSGHGHSHVDMAVFPSGTDSKDILERAKDGLYNAAIIVNKKEQIYGHIADMESKLYLKDVPVFIVYPFTEEEYKQGVVAIARSCETIEDIVKATKMTMAEYFDITYPLTEEQIAELEDVMTKKFKYKYTPTYLHNRTVGATTTTITPIATNVKKNENPAIIKDLKDLGTATEKNQIKLIDDTENSNLEELSVYGDDYYDSIAGVGYESSGFSEYELGRWEEIKDKSIYEYTDDEWQLYEKMYNGEPRYKN